MQRYTFLAKRYTELHATLEETTFSDKKIRPSKVEIRREIFPETRQTMFPTTPRIGICGGTPILTRPTATAPTRLSPPHWGHDNGHADGSQEAFPDAALRPTDDAEAAIGRGPPARARRSRQSHARTLPVRRVARAVATRRFGSRDARQKGTRHVAKREPRAATFRAKADGGGRLASPLPHDARRASPSPDTHRPKPATNALPAHGRSADERGTEREMNVIRRNATKR